MPDNIFFPTLADAFFQVNRSNLILNSMSLLNKCFFLLNRYTGFRVLLIFFFSAWLLSCNNEEQNKSESFEIEKTEFNDTVKNGSLTNVSGNSIFFGLYSPVEISNIFSDVELTYKPEFFLPTEWANHYTSSSKLALGLGLYGADFSMTKMFLNIEDAIKYMQVISMLSEKLGVPPELLSTFSDRAEKNLSDLDSISGIAYETFEQVSIYLIDSGREHSMSLILLGAWTEGIYIAMKYMDEAGEIDEKIVEKVIEQKYSLNFLMSMLKDDYQDLVIAHYYRFLKVLQNHFENLSINYKKNQVQIDLENKLIKSNWQQVNYSKSELDIVKEIISMIREEMSKP